MEPDSIVALLQPLIPDLIEDVRASFDDFDTHIAFPYRLTVEDTRPKAISLRTVHRWRERHGVSGHTDIRVHEDRNGMAYLFVQGNAFSVGLRVKKLDDSGQCYQHITQRQTDLRAQGYFDEFNMLVGHVLLGYRYTGGADELVPCLTDLSLSAEHVTVGGRYEMSWRRVIWTAGAGAQPIHPIGPSLFPPPAPPVVRPRRPATGSGENGAAGVGG